MCSRSSIACRVYLPHRPKEPVLLAITFLGAAGTVTGSHFAVQYGDRSLLVDFGMFQGMEEADQLNREPLHPLARGAEALVLTHAHTDHVGCVPRLLREGFGGPIFCTEPTPELCELLWTDSARLQQLRATAQAPPTFDENDALRALRLMKPRSCADRFNVMEGVWGTFYEAGHMLGSAWVELEFEPLPDWPQNKPVVVVFSGDIGRPTHPMLAPARRPRRADILVLESTYGDRLHPPTRASQQLAEAVGEARRRRSTLVIPAFALQRSHDLVYLFEDLLERQQIEPISLFLDSPMACKALDVYHDYPDYLSQEAAEKLEQSDLLLRYPYFRCCLASAQSRQIMEFSPPRVIISASGMAEGGRILHHLKRFLPDPDAQLLFSGFQCPGTRGRALLDGAKAVEIDGQWVEVRAQVGSLEGLSGHADYQELADWLSELSAPPAMTCLVHGDEPARLSQHQRLSEKGWQARCPGQGETVVVVP